MKKILIIDDSYLFRTHIKTSLESLENVEIIEAESAVKVFKSLRAILEDINLIILDIMMSELNGLEFFKIMKKDEILKYIPIMFISGKSDSNTVKKALAMGAADYLIKPVNSNEILNRVKRVLDTIDNDVNLQIRDHSSEYIEELITNEYERAIRAKSDLSFISFLFNSRNDAVKAMIIFKKKLRKIDSVLLSDNVLNVILPFTSKSNVTLVKNKLFDTLASDDILCSKSFETSLDLNQPQVFLGEVLVLTE